MNERVEAAAETVLQLARDTDGWTYRQLGRAAVKAADAVMFSDEAVERAAMALNAEHAPAWEKLPDWVKEDWRKQVRTVIAALKGDA